MTYEKNYALGDKLKREFRGRGADVKGMRATPTPELMRRAAMGKDPRENCAEAAFRESYSSRRTGTSANRSTAGNYGGYSAQRRTAGAGANKNSFYTAKSTAKRGSANTASRNKAKTRANTTAGKAKAKKSARSYDDEGGTRVTPAAEVSVKHKKLSPVFLACLLVGTIMVTFMITEISSVYKAANDVAQLENDIEELKAEAAELELKLEEKNDIREIEKIATTKLGMAKEDSLQRRYVSLSDGERIELIDTGEDDDQSLGVMLSSVFESIGRFFTGQ